MRFCIGKPRGVAREATNNLFSSQTCIEFSDFKYISYLIVFFTLLNSSEGYFLLLIQESVILCWFFADLCVLPRHQHWGSVEGSSTVCQSFLREIVVLGVNPHRIHAVFIYVPVWKYFFRSKFLLEPPSFLSLYPKRSAALLVTVSQLRGCSHHQLSWCNSHPSSPLKNVRLRILH